MASRSGSIPTIETIELTPDAAKRALDSYLLAKEKYANTDLDQYENLQDFVDQTEDGKKFEADVKAAGFPNVTDWNLAVTTLGLTYSSVTDDQTSVPKSGSRARRARMRFGSQPVAKRVVTVG